MMAMKQSISAGAVPRFAAGVVSHSGPPWNRVTPVYSDEMNASTFC